MSLEIEVLCLGWTGSLNEGQKQVNQGDPLEMLIFNLTIHHLWGRVLTKFQEPRKEYTLTMGTLRPN
jgi:hypothetical protein